MYESELKKLFKDIFKIDRVTLDQPSEALEQDTMFIEIERSKDAVKDGVVKSMVTGKCTVYAQSDKIPFGFFSKAIRQADPSLTKDLFFSDFETNSNYYRNLVERSFNFTYFYSGQYDPQTGIINEIEFIKGD